MGGQFICVLFLYTVCHAVVLIPSNILQTKCISPNGRSFLWVIQCGQVVTERSSGLAWTCVPSIQVWEVGTLTTDPVLQTRTSDTKKIHLLNTTNHSVECVSSFRLPKQTGFIVFYPMIDIQLWDEFRESILWAFFYCLSCFHTRHMTELFSWSACALTPFFRTIVLRLNLTYFPGA